MYYFKKIRCYFWVKFNIIWCQRFCLKIKIKKKIITWSFFKIVDWDFCWNAFILLLFLLLILPFKVGVAAQFIKEFLVIEFSVLSKHFLKNLVFFYLKDTKIETLKPKNPNRSLIKLKTILICYFKYLCHKTLS